MIVLLAVGVGRVAVALARDQDREQQPVRPCQHQSQGVQEGPEAGKKRFTRANALKKLKKMQSLK